MGLKYEQILESKLNKWKSNLIDLTKRNRLLNFADHSSSVLKIQIDMESFFNGLLEDYRYEVNSIVDMEKFVAKERRRKKRSMGNSNSSSDEIVTTIQDPALDEISGDDEVERAYEKLEKQINNIRLKAKTFSDEKGVHTLYVAFGFLKWKESSDSNIYLKSPIVLLPVTLKRESVNEPYWIEKYSDEITINPTLLQKLKVDFGLNISFKQDEGAFSLNDLIKQFQAQIRSNNDWEIIQESYLGIFSFSKLVMFNDFEQYSNLLKRNDLVQKLAGVIDYDDNFEQDYRENIREHDRTSRSAESFQILDADSSQQEAILAAQKGKSFIISGPPGTGKSQTITNIIAECLAKGKQVLFVSEKKAALDVVKKRLDDQKLGDFCLELHNNNANKKYVIEELYRTYSLLQSPSVSAVNFDSFDKIKAKLNEYVDALHTPVEPLQFTPHYIHGLLSKLHDIEELTFTIENIQAIDRPRLEDINELLHRMETYAHVLVNHDKHVWKGALPTRFTLELQGNITANFRKLANGLEIVKSNLEDIIQFIGANWATAPEVIEKIQKLNSTLNYIPRIPVYWLKDDDVFDKSKEVYNQIKDRFLQFEREKIKLNESYHEDAINLPLDQIEYTLTKRFQPELQGLFKNFNAFVDNVIADNIELINVVKRAQKELTILLSVQNFANELYGIHFENVTTENIDTFLTISKYILENPCPTPLWFDRGKYDELVEHVKEVESKITEYVKERTEFEKKFDLDLLTELDVKAIQQRFIDDYNSILRIFKKNYRDDKKKLKFYKKEKAKMSFEELTKDLRQAVKLVEKKNWLINMESELKHRFGKLFQGERTDWDQLRQNLKSVYDLCSFLEASSLPKDGIEKLMLDLNSYQLERVKLKIQEVTETLSSFQKNMEILIDQLYIPNVLVDKGTDVTVVGEKLRRVDQISEEIQIAVRELEKFNRKNRWKNLQEVISDINDLKNFLDLKQSIENEMTVYQKLYGPMFQGYKTDWNEVLSAIQWTQKILEIFDSKIPASTIEIIFDDSKKLHVQFMQLVEKLTGSWNTIARERNFFFTIFPKEGEVIEQKTFYQADISKIIHHLDVWVDESYRLEEWNAFQTILQDSARFGITEFVNEIMSLKYQNGNISELFHKRFYKLWLDYAYSVLPSLSQFNIEQHQRLIEEFKKMDKHQINQNGARLHQILMNNKKLFISSLSGRLNNEVFILNREVQKQKRHKPIRRLFSEIPNLLRALKPCLMMSPMSVSQFIDPNVLNFDVVIFDEASQIGSEDAIGSILRGKQIIIAGDNKQLPPTRFFGTTAEEDEEFVDEEDLTNEIYESVLDEAAVFMPIVPLKWHYRSKHESLIAFSNREFYNNELYTFPSASSSSNDGVSLVHVPEGVYDRGGSKKNRVEAKVVANLIFEHFRKSKHSLGVIAFSEAQQEAIRDYVDEMRKNNPEFEKFFSEEVPEPFFIKNLENVQGDERDTIIFSVGYGKDYNGNLHYNFGPLNKPGGERRLNVAITRAKYEVKIVSSILHTDLDDEKLTKRGPQLLKKYLYYASTGGKFSPHSGVDSSMGFDSPLEEDVYDALTARGLILHKQVGCSSYRIDLAVVDPNHPGRYLLGIECDGAAYHSSKTARDRDRLRQQVLESLGWRIHRIWSQDWFKRKRQEINKIVELATELMRKN